LHVGHVAAADSGSPLKQFLSGCVLKLPHSSRRCLSGAQALHASKIGYRNSAIALVAVVDVALVDRFQRRIGPAILNQLLL
jgi:hypothetical protein